MDNYFRDIVDVFLGDMSQTFKDIEQPSEEVRKDFPHIDAGSQNNKE